MKPTFRKSIPQPEYSYVVRKDVGTNIRTDWHYHPEYELVCVRKSCGTWLVGDYVGQFKSGDVILMGPDLPHCYRHDHEYITEGSGKEPGEVTAVLFLKEILGTSFLDLPEAKGIKNTLLLSDRGLKLTGRTRLEAGRILDKIQSASPGRRLIDMLSILQLIADTNEYQVLASNGFSYESDKIDNARISAILEFTFNNYQNQITIEEVAASINMGKHSFCRYFKEKTKKTYIQFLMEVRIGKACRLLIEDDMNIAEVCYSCGYNSISHFNHQFKAIKNQSPYEYKRGYIDLVTVKNNAFQLLPTTFLFS